MRAALPGMTNATAIVHAAPPLGADFTQYTVELDNDGSFYLGYAQPESERFLCVLEGSVTFGDTTLERHHYAWFPPGPGVDIHCAGSARVAVIEKKYAALGGAIPHALTGNALALVPKPLSGDDAVQVRTLLPEDLAFGCAVNTLTFQPGATLSGVEVHVMEHGLLMLEGEGIYRLGESWYPVKAGDFIWMAPYCPQWFGALGKVPAKYLIYKDWNRHPLR